LNGKSLYSVFVITPTSSIYSKIDTIMSKEKMEMFSLIVGIISAITVLIVFLGRMNSILNKEVTKRTRQLEESNGSLLMVNKKLESVNEQLKIHDKMQQEFLHLAAHELRGPIQTLLGFSEILSQNLGNTEPNGRHIKSINRNARRLKKLVNVVLDIAQIENNTLLMNKETFDLGPLILEIVMDYQSRFKEIKQVQDIEFVIDSGRIMDKPLLVVADKTRITQVITNLLDNAVEFVKRKDEVGKKTEINNKDNTLNKIIIRVQKAKASDNLTQIIVSIIDNGIGINKEVLPLLFTKFVSKSNMGTGLGLYISKKIVENHGGHIWAQNNYIENSEEEKWNSDYRNNGATFSFSLPLLDVDSYNNNNQNE
jgi:signal transduction histidine kinase